MSIGFTAPLTRYAHTRDRFELRFKVTVFPHREPRWLPPLFDETLEIARDLGSRAGSASEEFERLHGRILLRWNGEIVPGFHMPLTAMSTEEDIAEVMRTHRCDREKALQLLAQAAWDTHYASKARALVIRALVQADLAAH